MCASRFVLLALLSSSVFADEARDEAIRRDLSTLVSEITSRHPNPFTRISRDEFERRRQSLSASIPVLSDLKAYVEMRRLAASIGDAHTTLEITDSVLSQYGVRNFPVRVTLYDDGLFISLANQAGRRLLGYRVVSINGLTPDELIQAIRPYVSYDNEQWLRQQLGVMVRSPQLLAAMEIAPDANRSEWLVEDPLGRRELITLEGDETISSPDSINDPSIGYLSPTYTDLSLAYWFRYYPDQKLLFFKYNQCRERTDLPFSTFAADLFRALDTQPVDHLVVDLRDNTGGNSEVWRPFLSGLQSRYARLRTNPRFGFYGLISRLTFSSGMFAAQEIKRFAGALLVGEDTGGNPDAFGNTVSFRLPFSGLPGSVSTRYYSAFGPGVSGPAVHADLRVYRDSSDVFARFDPILFRVFTVKDAPDAPECRSCPVVSAASLRPGSPQSALSLSSVFGDFGGIRTEVASTLPLPVSLGGLEVLVGGRPARLLMVSANQINFQQPEAAARTVEVRRDGATIWAGEQLPAKAAPAIFLADPANFRRPGAILNEDGALNSPDRRARRGSVIQIFATGFPELDGHIEAGSLPPDGTLLRTRDRPRVWIGQWDAPVIFSGASPQFPGLWQLNVRIPGDSAITNLMPVAIHASGRTSNAVTIWVD